MRTGLHEQLGWRRKRKARATAAAGLGWAGLGWPRGKGGNTNKQGVAQHEQLGMAGGLSVWRSLMRKPGCGKGKPKYLALTQHSGESG